MNFPKTLPVTYFAFVALYFGISSNATTIEVRNNCPYTVWAAAVPGGGKELNQGDTWNVTAKPGQIKSRIWGRGDCLFDSSGHGKCGSGDCDGALECTTHGEGPNTLAEYSIGRFVNRDYIDISNVEGYNVPMEFRSVSPRCKRVIKCSADIVGDCPMELMVPGGCYSPCTVFQTDQYCCNAGGFCGPTEFSRFFKAKCPDAYSYPKDDRTSLFTCPTGTNYKVTFCP